MSPKVLLHAMANIFSKEAAKCPPKMLLHAMANIGDHYIGSKSTWYPYN